MISLKPILCALTFHAALAVAALPAQQISLSGIADYGVFLNEGAPNHFQVGDQVNYKLILDGSATGTFTETSDGLIAFFGGPSIAEFSFEVIRPASGTTLLEYSTLTTSSGYTPSSAARYTPAANPEFREWLDTGVSGYMGEVAGADVMLAGFFFYAGDIFGPTPELGESFTLAELLGNGDGLRDARVTVTLGAIAGGSAQQWHFVADASAVPEPGSAVLVFLAGFVVLARRRRGWPSPLSY